jgi:uncharacterized protein
MSILIHFEIAADRLDRAVKFYRNVFGWKIERLEESEEYWYVTTDDGEGFAVTGGLFERGHTVDSTINTFDVPSLDSAAKKITESGGKVLAPKISLPGLGYVQYCQDSEGNTFGIMEYDESAA